MLRFPPTFPLCIALLLVCSAAFATDAHADPYVDELIERAQQLELAQSRQWHALLHYRDNWILPGVTGQADDPAFYLAPRGKTDPRAELEATLRAFFLPAVEETPELQHPQCRFVARYRWLREALDFDPQRLTPSSGYAGPAWADGAGGACRAADLSQRSGERCVS